MERLDCVAYSRSRGLPPWLPPEDADLVVLDLALQPPMPSLAAWVVRCGRPTLAASTALVNGRRGAVMMADDGRVVGRQWQTHRGARDLEVQVLGDDLRAFRVGGRLIGAVVGADVWVPEVSRALVMMGVELLIGVALPALPAGLGLWREVQQNQVLGLEGGDRPSLLMPCEADPHGHGVTLLRTVRGFACFRVPWDPVEEVRAALPLLRQLNPALYLQHPWWEEDGNG